MIVMTTIAKAVCPVSAALVCIRNAQMVNSLHPPGIPTHAKMYNYGLIGDMASAALVGTDGAVDWCCFPRFDSPSVFAAILDQEDGGPLSHQPHRFRLHLRSGVPA